MLVKFTPRREITRVVACNRFHDNAGNNDFLEVCKSILLVSLRFSQIRNRRLISEQVAF